MRKITLFTLLVFLTAGNSIFATSDSVRFEAQGLSLKNLAMEDVHYDYAPGKFDNPANLLTDTFTYTPESYNEVTGEYTGNRPYQAWNSKTTWGMQQMCHLKYVSDMDEARWKCDIDIDSGKYVYAVDVWGRTGTGDADYNFTALPDNRDEVSDSRRIKMLLTSTDGVDTLWAPGRIHKFGNEELKDYFLSMPSEGAFRRYFFPDSVLPILCDDVRYSIISVFGDNLTLFELRFLTKDQPMANAGDDQDVLKGATVNLDASASSVDAADAIAYAWVSLTDETITLSDASIANPSFTAPQVIGDYQFELTVSNGVLSSVDTVTVSVSTTTSIEGSNMANFKVYPNPTNQGVYVVMESEGMHQINVVDLSGKSIFNTATVEKIYHISEDVLSSGVYFVQVTNGQNTRTEKIIVE